MPNRKQLRFAKKYGYVNFAAARRAMRRAERWLKVTGLDGRRPGEPPRHIHQKIMMLVDASTSGLGAAL